MLNDYGIFQFSPSTGHFVFWSRLSTAAQIIFLKQYLSDLIHCKIFFHIFTSQKSEFILQIAHPDVIGSAFLFLVEHTVLEQPTTPDVLDSVKYSELCHLWSVVETA